MFIRKTEIRFQIDNRSNVDAHVELYVTSVKGEITPLTPTVERLPAGGSRLYPPANEPAILVRAEKGREIVTLIAATKPFQPGVVVAGPYQRDRYVHPFYQVEDLARFDPGELRKLQIELETK